MFKIKLFNKFINNYNIKINDRKNNNNSNN